MKIAELDIPQPLKDFYVNSGIKELYPPQAEAVKKGFLDGKSLLAAIPTASGKTLLAEMAMLKSIAEGGKAIYIVPLRALASEKYERFMELSKLEIKKGGVKVGIATGDYDSKDEWLGDRDIIVATSEKTDSLLRNGSSWLSNLTVVVADEVHLIDSANRGPTLEVTLAKLMKLNPSIQVLALSATIGNARELSGWLKAELVVSDWRPTQLKEGVFFGRAIKFPNEKRVLTTPGPDDVIALVQDTLEEGGQCIVFANTRKSSESVAQKVSKTLHKRISDEDKERYRRDQTAGDAARGDRYLREAGFLRRERRRFPPRRAQGRAPPYHRRRLPKEHHQGHRVYADAGGGLEFTGPQGHHPGLQEVRRELRQRAHTRFRV